MRFLVFLLVALGVLVVGHVYVGWRISSEMSGRRRHITRGLIVALPVITFGSFAVRVAGVESALGDVALAIGFCCLGFSSLLFTLVVLRDLLWLVAWLAGRAGAPAVIAPERRKVLMASLNIGKLGLAGALLGYGAAEARSRADVRRVTVPIADLPAALEGFRIVQLTDIHVGETIKRAYLEAIVDAASELDADLVAITGDIVDGSVDHLRDDVEPLARIKSRHGTYVCTGNHEYYAGVHRWVEHFTALGLHVLGNASRLIEVEGARLLVGGVHDYLAGATEPSHESSPERAMAGAPEHDLAILLAHQPRSIFAAEKAGFHLQLSGHTHGGQFFPWTLFARLAQPYVAGLHQHGRALIYVSRGTGYWGPPLRLGAPAEITLLTLTRAPA
jgi:predicted MPP superfamily phosphohydrolase